MLRWCSVGSGKNNGCMTVVVYPLPPAPRVNKELKDKYKTHMNEFYDWGITMTPLLPLETGTYNYGERTKLAKYKQEHYGNSKRRALWLRDVLKGP